MHARAFKPAVTFLIMIFLLSACPASYADPLIKGPYLMLSAKGALKVTDNTAMAIRWESDGNALTGKTCTLEWGPTTNYGQSATVSSSSPSGKWFTYSIVGLTPGALTCYRLTCLGSSYEGVFRTPPADNATALTFFGYGDTRGDKNSITESRQKYVLGEMKKNIERDPSYPYTLLMHTGDFVENGEIAKEWDRNNPMQDSAFFAREKWSMWILSRLAVAGVLGNHEGRIAPGTMDYPNFGQKLKTYWPYPFYPDNRDAFYYGFDYGPAHFTVIDANDRVGGNLETGLNRTAAGLSAGTTQYEWLAADLNSTKTWKIIAIHNPVYASSGARDRFKNTPALVSSLHNLFKAKGVRLVLQGHNHYYSRKVVDGITYLTLGGGGAPLSTPTDSDGKRIFQFGRFDISGNALTYQIIDSKGIVQETNTITIP